MLEEEIAETVNFLEEEGFRQIETNNVKYYYTKDFRNYLTEFVIENDGSELINFYVYDNLWNFIRVKIPSAYYCEAPLYQLKVFVNNVDQCFFLLDHAKTHVNYRQFLFEFFSTEWINKKEYYIYYSTFDEYRLYLIASENLITMFSHIPRTKISQRRMIEDIISSMQ